MSNIRAVILAAGQGSRLGRVGEGIPKALLQVGGRHLIQHQLEALADSGVGPVHVVVGYEADKIREAVGVQAEYIENPRWASTNSMYSFWLARDAIQGDVLVLNSDVLFAPEILNRLLDVPGDAIAIDTDSGHGREQMKVQVVEGRVVQMSKELPAEAVSGENIGILKLSAETARALFDKSEEIIGTGRDREWLGASIAAAARGLELRAVDMAGIPWIEIDFAVDLVRARKEVWPTIRGHASWRQRIWRSTSLALGTGFAGGAALLAGLGLALERPVPDGWETVPIEAVQTTRADPEGSHEGWWLLREDQPARARVTVPGQVCIESRPFDPTGSDAPHLVETSIDGEPIDHHTTTHADGTVCDRSSKTVDSPDGSHVLGIRIHGPPEAAYLVRIRQVVSQKED